MWNSWADQQIGRADPRFTSTHAGQGPITPLAPRIEAKWTLDQVSKCFQMLSGSESVDSEPEFVAGAVCWFRTSRSHVSRHPGLMSRVIPE